MSPGCGACAQYSGLDWMNEPRPLRREHPGQHPVFPECLAEVDSIHSKWCLGTIIPGGCVVARRTPGQKAGQFGPKVDSLGLERKNWKKSGTNNSSFKHKEQSEESGMW